MRLLNIGGGSKSEHPIPEFYKDYEHILLDSFANSEVDIVMDARNLWKEEIGKFDVIYCSHVLEHFDVNHLPVVMLGIHNSLAPEGFVDIRVPDLAAVAKELARTEDPDTVAYVSAAGIPVTLGHLFYGYPPDIARNEGMAHRNGFTVASLRKALDPHFPHRAFCQIPDVMELRALASRVSLWDLQVPGNLKSPAAVSA